MFIPLHTIRGSPSRTLNVCISPWHEPHHTIMHASVGLRSKELSWKCAAAPTEQSSNCPASFPLWPKSFISVYHHTSGVRKYVSHCWFEQSNLFNRSSSLFIKHCTSPFIIIFFVVTDQKSPSWFIFVVFIDCHYEGFTGIFSFQQRAFSQYLLLLHRPW